MTATANRTKILWVRTTEHERAELDRLSVTLGFGSSKGKPDASKLIRSRFPEVFQPNGSTTSKPRGGPERAKGTVDLSEWLAERTGLPQAVTRLNVREGRVAVGGSVVKNLMIGRKRLDEQSVTLDGEPVRSPSR